MIRESCLVRFRTRSATQYLTGQLIRQTQRWFLTPSPELAYTFDSRDQAERWATVAPDKLPIPTDAITEVVTLDQVRAETFTLPDGD